MRATGHADRQQAGAEGMLPENERRTASSTALLGIGVREQGPFLGDPIDVRGVVPHDAMVVGTDVVHTDVISPQDDDIRLLSGGLSMCGHSQIVGCNHRGRVSQLIGFGIGTGTPEETRSVAPAFGRQQLS